MISTLLQTKLFIPPTRASIVPRPHLIEQLNNSLSGRLTLISAPAGFGKTTLVTDWLSQRDHPVAWVSLGEDDSEPQQFFSYMAAAIQPFPDSQNSLVNLLQSPQPLSGKALAAALVNDLVPVSTPCLLILDDYHEINSTEIDVALTFLLDHMPPHLHVLITSRADPGFPLSRLRARNQLTELRAQDLRFSVEETAVFLQKVIGITLTPNQIAALETRTEGWVAGLQMAALSMQNRDDVAGFIDNFTGSNRFIMDYLTDEVLQQIPPAIHDFLLQTSILTRLSAPLCTAVIGNGDSNDVAQNHLDYLDHANLFLIPLDENRTWYRYHHLFADLLRRKQGVDVKERHQRASQWYEENGLITDALYHARAAQDFERATQLIVAHTRQGIAQGNSDVVFTWIKAMPDASVRAHSLLAIGKAWDLLYQQQLSQIESYLLSAEAALVDDGSPSSQNYHGEINAIRAMTARYAGDSQQSVVLCRRALAQLPEENVFARSFILTALSGALRAAGETQEAIAAYLESMDVCAKTGHTLALMGAIHQLQELYVECGRLRDADHCGGYLTHPSAFPRLKHVIFLHNGYDAHSL